MLEKILDQIKKLSEDQIIEFNQKFKEFYKPIEQKVMKQNSAKKRKEEEEKKKIAIKNLQNREKSVQEQLSMLRNE